MAEESKSRLSETVRFLSEEIGPRSFRDVERLCRAADWIEERLRSLGLKVTRQPFSYGGNEYFNIVGEVNGKGPEVLVIGAHYDTVVGSPGADDNASGVAGLLELARLAAERPLAASVRFAAFCLEEPPVFMTSRMGSFVYARSLKEEKADVRGMISLEMIGYYSEAKGSQLYPLSPFRWIYPKRGDFIAFVGDIASRPFTRRVRRAFQEHSRLPVVSLNTVSLIPGVNFSDHRSFRKFGFPAFMATDTAFYRNPNYHGPDDRAGTLDYARMEEFVLGLYGALGQGL
jgi:Zn-dependent M28 family amino/carboxypeptidase